MNNYRPTSNSMSKWTVYYACIMRNEHVLIIVRKTYLKMQFSTQATESLLQHGFTNCFGVLSPLGLVGGRTHFLIVSPRTARHYVADPTLPRTNVSGADALNSYSGCRITSGPRVILFLISPSRRIRVSWLPVTPHPLLFQIYINIIQPTADKSWRIINHDLPNMRFSNRKLGSFLSSTNRT